MSRVAKSDVSEDGILELVEQVGVETFSQTSASPRYIGIKNEDFHTAFGDMDFDQKFFSDGLQATSNMDKFGIIWLAIKALIKQAVRGLYSGSGTIESGTVATLENDFVIAGVNADTNQGAGTYLKFESGTSESLDMISQGEINIGDRPEKGAFPAWVSVSPLNGSVHIYGKKDVVYQADDKQFRFDNRGGFKMPVVTNPTFNTGDAGTVWFDGVNLNFWNGSNNIVIS